jgi:selenocysteine-specific elongation factor
VVGPARVAVNLRGVELARVGRGAALTDSRWPSHPSVLDVDLVSLDRAETGRGTGLETGRVSARLARELTLHAGTAAVPVRTQVLPDGLVRLRLSHPLPLVVGDRAVLRDPGRHEVLAGVRVRVVDPPTRRRDGRARGASAAYRGVAATGPEVTRGVRELVAWLREHPLQAASREQLDGWALTAADLAGAADRGEIARIGGVVLTGDAVSRAEAVVRSLDQPFTVGEAAWALATSRRVAVPLLERLDATLVTRRLPDGTREVRPTVRP